MLVKLCGLRTVDDARAAIDAGADAIGFILAESSRQVTSEFVASLREHIPVPPSVVGVTVNESPSSLLSLFEAARLDMVQLSGNEPLSILDHLDIPVIKSLKFREGTSRDDATRIVDSWLSHPHAPEFVLVDGYHDGAHGGTGTRANWWLANEIAVRYPIVLAGGLTPDNVAEAIRQVKPSGVDTSSSTETNGSKDPAKLASFVRNAREAFKQLHGIS